MLSDSRGIYFLGPSPPSLWTGRTVREPPLLSPCHPLRRELHYMPGMSCATRSHRDFSLLPWSLLPLVGGHYLYPILTCHLGKGMRNHIPGNLSYPLNLAHPLWSSKKSTATEDSYLIRTWEAIRNCPMTTPSPGKTGCWVEDGFKVALHKPPSLPSSTSMANVGYCPVARAKRLPYRHPPLKSIHVKSRTSSSPTQAHPSSSE